MNAKNVYGVEHNQMKPFTFSGRYASSATTLPVSFTRTVNGIANYGLEHPSSESEEMSTRKCTIGKITKFYVNFPILKSFHVSVTTNVGERYAFINIIYYGYRIFIKLRAFIGNVRRV